MRPGRGYSDRVSRFLFVVLPLAGHANAAAALGRALTGRGHQVAWVGSEAYFRPIVDPADTVYPTGTRLYRPQADRGVAALKSLWEGFVVPFARFTLPAVEKAVQAFRPDILIVDQHALAGALVAQRNGMRWATLISQSMELTRPYRALPKVDEWIRDCLAALAAQAGLAPDESFDPLFSPYLVLACTSTALTGTMPLPDHFALTGPLLACRAAGPDFPWDRLDPGRRHVLVTVGTLAAEVAKDFHARALEALRPLGDRVQGIVAASAEALSDPPEHILVAPQVPMLALLRQVDVVVCHGGLNSVCEALAYGVPLVVAPIRHDQPVTAAQVVAAGAGIRVRFGRVRPAELRAAVTAVLDDPAYRMAAGRVRDSFAAAGGAPAAAERLERLERSSAGGGQRPEAAQRRIISMRPRI
jgi:zeaxanthin glucosyltransferase